MSGRRGDAMTAATKTPKELLAENKELRLRLEEAEETLRAIGSGEVDAFVVSGPGGEEQVFTLKGAELPYRILVESMNEGAATLAADGTIFYCNKRLSSMLKIPLENLIGTNLGSYVEPNGYLTYTALLENCTQEPQSEEIFMTTAAGYSIPVFISCCVNDISGTQGISVVVTDLTLQRRNEAILTSEKFTTSIIDQTSDAMFVCDTKGKIIRASQSAHKLCGMNPLLKPFNKIFRLRIKESGDKFSLSAHMRSGVNASIEVYFKRYDGRIFTLLLNATHHKSIQNMDIGSIITLTDITERTLYEEALHMSELRLQAAYGHLQIVNEELQVAGEELQAQGEELQNQNQELKELWASSKASEEELILKNSELETAKKLAEGKRRWLAAVMEALPIGIAITDVRGGTIQSNRAYEQVWGEPRPETQSVEDYAAYKAWWADTGKPVEPEEWASALAVRTGETVTGQLMKIRRFDDATAFVINSASPVRDADGNIIGCAVAIQDITELKRVEASLLESRQDLDRAQEVANIGSWRLDVRSNLLTWSDESYRIFGISKGTPLTYETFLSTIHPDDRHYVDTQWDVALRGGPYDIEHRLLVNDQVKWVREKAYLEFEKDGTLIGGFGITQEITERKQAEIALQASERRIQQALQVSRSFTFDWLPVTDQVIRSDSCATILKLTGDEAVNDTGGHYFHSVHPDDRPRFMQIFRDLTPAADSYVTEYRYAYKDGSEITLEETGQASFDSTGKMLRLVGVSTDITLRKNAEQSLKIAYEVLESRVAERTRELADSISQLQNEIRERKLAEESLRNETTERIHAMETLREKEQMLIQQSRQAAMGEMIGNIAHQWRQPLNTLGLYTQSLGLFFELPNFNKELLDNSIAKSMEIIKHMSKTIDDFRNFFKPEKEKSDFYLVETINNTLSLLEGNFTNPMIIIDLVVHDNPVING